MASIFEDFNAQQYSNLLDTYGMDVADRYKQYFIHKRRAAQIRALIPDGDFVKFDQFSVPEDKLELYKEYRVEAEKADERRSYLDYNRRSQYPPTDEETDQLIDKLQDLKSLRKEYTALYGKKPTGKQYGDEQWLRTKIEEKKPQIEDRKELLPVSPKAVPMIPTIEEPTPVVEDW